MCLCVQMCVWCTRVCACASVCVCVCVWKYTKYCSNIHVLLQLSEQDCTPTLKKIFETEKDQELIKLKAVRKSKLGSNVQSELSSVHTPLVLAPDPPCTHKKTEGKCRRGSGTLDTESERIRNHANTRRYVKTDTDCVTQ